MWYLSLRQIKSMLLTLKALHIDKLSVKEIFLQPSHYNTLCFPVAQLVEHGASNAKIMGSIPRESKSW